MKLENERHMSCIRTENTVAPHLEFTFEICPQFTKQKHQQSVLLDRGLFDILLKQRIYSNVNEHLECD